MSSTKEERANPVTVAVRIRPLNERELRVPNQEISLDFGEQHISLPKHDATFCFDLVLGPEHTNQTLYESVASPIVESALMGINGTIFAYGQTASGKTFSMQGDTKSPGILRLAAAQIFQEVASPANSTCKYAFVASYIEIYNERVKDLLSTTPGKGADDLKIREDRVMGFYADGASERPVNSAKDILQLFVEGEKRRHVAGTDMNLKSSRSHTIFMINMTCTLQHVTTKSRLSLVDLAGSESVRQTNAEGDRLKEGAQINKSLLALSMVISSLSSGKKDIGHVGYRDSKLTQILRPSLSGNCKTAVLVCVSPAMTYAFETLSSLKFASSAKQIKTSYVVNRTHAANMRSYQDQIDYLTKTLQEEQDRNLAEAALMNGKGVEIAEIQQAELEGWKMQHASVVDELARVEKERDEAIKELEQASVAFQALQSETKTQQQAWEQAFQKEMETYEHHVGEVQQQLEQAKLVMQEQELGWAESKQVAAEQESELSKHALEIAQLRTQLNDQGALQDELDHLKFVVQSQTETMQEYKQELQAQEELLQEERLRFAQEKSELMEQFDQHKQALQAQVDAVQRNLEEKCAEYEAKLVQCNNHMDEQSAEREERIRLAFEQEKQSIVASLENKYMDALQDVERAGMEREQEIQDKFASELEQARAEMQLAMEQAETTKVAELEALRAELDEEKQQWIADSSGYEQIKQDKQELEMHNMAMQEEIEALSNESSLLRAKLTVLEQDLVCARAGGVLLESVETERQALLTFRVESEHLQQELRARLEKERNEAKTLRANAGLLEAELNKLKHDRDRQRAQHAKELENLRNDLCDNENLGLMQAQRENARLMQVQQRLHEAMQEQEEQLEVLRKNESEYKERVAKLEKCKFTSKHKEMFVSLQSQNETLQKENAELKQAYASKTVSSGSVAAATTKRRMPLTPLQ